MDTVVSRLGLEAEGPLRIGVDGPAGGTVLARGCQRDFVAALLLHALGQVADGDLATHAEPVWHQQQNLGQASYQCGNVKNQADSTEADFL